MIAPGAVWRGPIPNRTPGGMHNPSLGLVLHVIEGSLGAADSVFHDPNWRASAHWGVGADGTLWQWVDTADKAWAQVAGNPDYHSVETEGWDSTGLTAAQVATLAALYRWGHETFAWPLQLADVVGQRGFAWHGMGGDAWGGHYSCPGTIRRGQRQAILDAAHGGPPTPQEDDDMPVLFTHAGGIFIGKWGRWCRHVPTPGLVAFYERAGVKWNNTDGTHEVQADVFGQMTLLPDAG